MNVFVGGGTTFSSFLLQLEVKYAALSGLAVVRLALRSIAQCFYIAPFTVPTAGASAPCKDAIVRVQIVVACAVAATAQRSDVGVPSRVAVVKTVSDARFDHCDVQYFVCDAVVRLEQCGARLHCAVD